ncbi:DNA polymerase III beta subunit [hydrothermal vent metagenome]|uniref:DNA polymerase III beta subunit n=1 Tax=hydrothermal vent metagenome TaxID=652676 RepID=A0A1W1EI25_9ZZZZ
MKIEIQKQIIESIVINTQPFLDKKDATQITSHIYFNIENNKCIVKATDLEIGIKIITKDLNINENGNFTVNGKKLLDIIKILKDDNITLELNEEVLIIKQDKSKFKLPTFKSSEFPKFPTIQNKGKITLDSLNLIKNLKKITPSIDNNNPKYELNGALIDIKESVTNIVGTDTKRLAVASIYNKNEKKLSIIIPKKAIVEIEKIFLEKIDIFYDPKELIIQNDKYFIFTKLLNGKFPDYNKIIPKEIKYSIEFPKKEMLEAIKQISIVSQDITVKLTPDTVYFSSLMQNSHNVEARTQLELKLNINEDIELNFNSRYLIDFLSQIENDSFILGINSQKLPFLVKDKDFITIIMPIRN